MLLFVPVIQLVRELEAITSFSEDEAASKWANFQRKLKIVWNEEAASRPSLQIITDKQVEELATFNDENGLCPICYNYSKMLIII